MNVRFGNLTVNEFQARVEVKLNEDDWEWMSEHRQNNANVTDDNKFHIFDMPFGIVAGADCGPELIKILGKTGYNFKRNFTVEVNQPS